MFTVLCRHVHSGWENTKAFTYVIAKSNIMKTWTYIIFCLAFREYTTCQQGS